MIAIFKNKDIDRKMWDDLIFASPQFVPYAISWYLDVACPRWEAVIISDNDKYLAVMPFAPSSRFIWRYIRHPFFCQQFGYFSVRELQTGESLSACIEKLQKNHAFIEYHFNIENERFLMSLPGTILKGITHHLDLQRPYEQIYKTYSQGHKRNIKNARNEQIMVRQVYDIRQVTDIFKKNKGIEIALIKEEDYERFINLGLNALKHAHLEMLIAEGTHGNILAGGIFLFINDRLYYLMGASTEEGKATSAMFLIMDQVIRNFSGKATLLDFEGSTMPGIARFFKGFGSIPLEFAKWHYHKYGLMEKLIKIYQHVRSR